MGSKISQNARYGPSGYSIQKLFLVLLYLLQRNDMQRVDLVKVISRALFGKSVLLSKGQRAHVMIKIFDHVQILIWKIWQNQPKGPLWDYGPNFPEHMTNHTTVQWNLSEQKQFVRFHKMGPCRTMDPKFLNTTYVQLLKNYSDKPLKLYNRTSIEQKHFVWFHKMGPRALVGQWTQNSWTPRKYH